MLRISNIKMAVEHTEIELHSKVAKILKVKINSIEKITPMKKSIDARRKNNIFFNYTVNVKIKNEDKYVNNKNIIKIVEEEYLVPKVTSNDRPIIVGTGPCGLFCGLTLAKAGLKPIILERGPDVDQRIIDVENFKETRELNEDSNIQFGEGGAGTFSDGKLTTGINDKRIREVLNEFVLAEAPKEILYDAKPHIGTDKLITVVKKIRQKIESLGGEVKFKNKVIDLIVNDEKIKGIVVQNEQETYEIYSNRIVFATGHSARDIFKMFYKHNVQMKAKPFSVGVRIEHKQSFINKCQYGDEKKSKQLGSAEYKINTHLDNGRGVYSFCMCPGGKVVPATSEKGRVVVNGMSNYLRDEDNANSALLVSVTEEDFKRELNIVDDNPLSGMLFQQKIEEEAFILGGSNYSAPCQLAEDFLQDKISTSFGKVIPSYEPNVVFKNIKDCLPSFVIESLKEGLIQLDKKIKGFASNDAVLTAVESRSSSPVKIFRDDEYNTNILGLLVAGEGAGFAGGITSASVDGIKCAEKIIDFYKREMSE